MSELVHLSLQEAASALDLPVESVEALVGAGYLPATNGDGSARIAHSDLKAFVARNASGGTDSPDVDGLLSGVELAAEDPLLDASALLEAVEERGDEMATRAYEIFTSVFPEALEWPDRRRDRFVEQARDRFAAIIVVARQGDSVDEGLLEELSDVGAAAAMSGSALPEILLTLRVSRDLMVQTAVDLAEDRGRHGGLALSLLLTQVLPSLDRLTDAVARGYWSAIVRREEESRARFEHVVEHSSDGVYEVDVDGFVTYVNPSLATMLGRDAGSLTGERLADVLVPADPADTVAAVGTTPDGSWYDREIRRADGLVRLVKVRVEERLQHGGVVGYDGVVRDVTAERDLERQKNAFLGMVTHELRQPVTTILGLGITLDTYADELTLDRVARVGRTIHQQAERIARLADDLFDVSRLEANALALSLRAVELDRAVDAALGMVERSDDIAVRVRAGLLVQADPRRLEQVVAHLAENAVLHGAPPVVIDASETADGVELRVTDHGTGLGAAMIPGIFDVMALTPVAERSAADGRGHGHGLALSRGLVEAMGGRIRYEANPAGGAVFAVTLPRP